MHRKTRKTSANKNVHSRFSYNASKVFWGGKFRKIFRQEGDRVAIDLVKRSAFDPVILSASLDERLVRELEAEAENAANGEGILDKKIPP